MKRTHILLAVLLLLALLPGAGLNVKGQTSTPIFVNEIHYDNVSTDQGEAIELAGPAGTDLSGWSLVLYNGNGGAPYSTTSLAGTLPDQQDGYGTTVISYPVNGIQNGSPDGIALVNAAGIVVQFISYEGSFAAVGGPADGMTSTDIGVSEPYDTPVGQSLQLTGSGSIYEDFAWAAAQPNTFYAVNTGQSFGGGTGPAVPKLLLTELVVTPTEGEFVEIYNPSAQAVDLSDYYLTDATFAGGSTYYYNIVTGSNAGGGGFADFHARFPDGATIAAGAYQTIALNGSANFVATYSLAPDYELYDDGTDNGEQQLREALPGSINGQGGLTNSGEVAVLYYWDGASDLVVDVDYALWGDKDEAVDKTGVTIDGPDADSDPTAYQPDTAITAQDVIALGAHAFTNSWQRDALDEGAEVTAGGNGVGGEDETSEDLSNTWCEDGPTPGAASACEPPPPPSDLVINEINADPDVTLGDANGDGVSQFSDDEFVEIVNKGDAGVDIGGWTISDGFSVRHVFPAGTIVPADCSIVVFGGGSPTGDFGYSVVQTASSGALGFNNGGDTVTLADAAGAIIATYSYGSEGGQNQSLTRDPDITGPEPLVLHSTATGSDGALFSPGTRIDGTRFGGCPIPDVCGAPATLIHDVQGDGATSPLQGQVVSIEGVVVGDFQYGDDVPNDVYDNNLNGFYIQEEDGDADTNPLTSEGVFVYAWGAPDVTVGDRVRVTGVVAEYSTSGGASLMTELTNVSQILLCEEPAAMPAATALTLPVSDVGDFEHYEGMLVTFPQGLVIAEYYNYDRFGEIVLATPLPVADRLFQPTSYLDDTGEIIAALDLIARSRITLDDGRSNQNPDPAVHPNGGIFATADPANRFRGGDLVQNATGVVDDTFGRYRIQPVQGADYTEANPRPAAPDDVGGSLQVASFNVLNYFLTLDDGVNDICGPDLEQECRGADTPEEFERQRTKILSALATIEADVFGLIEMENTTGVTPLADIVAGLNDMMGAGTYAYVETGTIGTDAIKVGIIYRPDSVTPLGSYAILDSSVDARFDDSRNRPVLAQTFVDDESGGIFTVAVNHLKSKGSDCGPGDDDPYQGNCNLTRTLAAQAMVDWLATDPTGSGDTDFLITGDLNAYDKEDPIDAILAGPDDTLGTEDDYVDLVAQYEGEFAYSYVFDGQLGYLDHALASPGLAGEVTGTTVWHINADEPDIIDYDMTFKQDAQDALYEENPFRASDHDPVIVGLDLRVPDAQVTLSPDTLWPPNHKYVTVEADVIGDLANVALVSATSDEPDAGLDEEDVPYDIVILDDYTFDLRAERYDEGDGRTYTITYFVTGYQGDSTFVSATVFVPHDQSPE